MMKRLLAGQALEGIAFLSWLGLFSNLGAIRRFLCEQQRRVLGAELRRTFVYPSIGHTIDDTNHVEPLTVRDGSCLRLASTQDQARPCEKVEHGDKKET